MSEWIEWNGGAIPTGINQRVDVKMRNGDTHQFELASTYSWNHYDNDGDIIAYRLANVDDVPTIPPVPQHDMVNHPPHYTAGGIECIDAIRAALTPDEFRGHCKANAIKYIWRERNKGGDESIRKAIWYLTEMLK